MRANTAHSAGRVIVVVLLSASVSGTGGLSAAFAQGARHADRVDATIQTLSRGAPCSDDSSESYMRRRMAASNAVQPVLYEALLDISLSDSLCESVRSAAGRLAWEIVETPTTNAASRSSGAGSGSSAAVAAIVSEAYAEAAVRAAQLSFEVAPPPRNITKGRPSRAPVAP